jgi:hypothetical protein
MTYFVSQSTVDASSASLPGIVPDALHNTDIPHIERATVLKLLLSLDIGKATGPDGIGNRLLKEAAPSICDPLCALFNKSLQAGVFPDCWKRANVIPIHKKNSLTDCGNYRPISLLPCISKVFEKLIFNHVYSFWKEHNVISAKQSGFTPGDSTVNQLTSLSDAIYRAFENGTEVRAVFLDLSKAFDKVWHKGLIYKLKRAGIPCIRGDLLAWFRSNALW